MAARRRSARLAAKRAAKKAEAQEAEPILAPGPHMFYCDTSTIIREVRDLRELRAGDHCMCPLNLARGALRWLDVVVDFLASMELVQFWHHFICLGDIAFVDENGVARMADGMEVYVAEYTNTPEEFAKEASRHGISAGLMDKATYKKTGLSYYRGSRIYKVLEDMDLTDCERKHVVRRAEDTIQFSEQKRFPKYTMWGANCEHVANNVRDIKADNSPLRSKRKRSRTRSHSRSRLRSQTTNDASSFRSCAPSSSTPSKVTGFQSSASNSGSSSENRTRARSLSTGSKRKAAETWSSPQVAFASWNIFRWSLQLCGLACLWALHVPGLYIVALVGFYLFAAAPVLLQSIAQFAIAVGRLREYWRRGRVKRRAFRHLLYKELFRLLLVGLGSTSLLCYLPRYVLDLEVKDENVWAAAITGAFLFYFLNAIYSTLAQGVLLLIRQTLGL